MEEIFFLAFGLIFGSFLNVVIYRLPLKKNIVFPRSSCPVCNHKIAFYDNIPLLSYVFLLGRCRGCKTRISPIYPFVEALTAFSFWYSAHLYFRVNPLHTFATILFISIIIALAFIDLKHKILPDPLTLGGGALFLVYSFFHPQLTTINGLGSAFGATLFFTGIYFFYLKVRKIEGLGMGDIKMMLILGAFLGINKLVVALLIASTTGLITGLFFIVFKGRNLKFQLPFGTFLSLGSYISLFWGDSILKLLQSIYF